MTISIYLYILWFFPWLKKQAHLLSFTSLSTLFFWILLAQEFQYNQKLSPELVYLKKEKIGMDHQEFFQLIPSEIIVNIISRLPIPTILLCKSVCKSWLDLLQTPDFVQCHLSKSRPRLIQQQFGDRICYISEPVGLCNFIPNLPHFKYHTRPEILDLRILDPPEFKDLPRPSRNIKASVDGLLIICHEEPATIEIMNPTTREYIQIRPSQLPGFASGFGVSRKTREYKVIRICADKCEVYTLGTGSWRIISSSIPPHLEHISHSFGAFLNGNLHWLAHDFNNDRVLISCFDLESEHFRMFASPPLPPRERTHTLRLSAWDGCLWLCDISSSHGEVVMWALKDYGDDKSWRKVRVFNSRRQLKRPPIRNIFPGATFDRAGYYRLWKKIYRGGMPTPHSAIY